MSAGRGWSGASHAGSNHPALACASAAPPYPRRGFLSCTYVAMFKSRTANEQDRLAQRLWGSLSRLDSPTLLSGESLQQSAPAAR